MIDVLGGLGALKTAFDLVKGLKEADDAARRNTVAAELLEKLLAVHAAHSQLVAEMSELKEQLQQFEHWESEKQRYELQDAGFGALAYAVKETLRGGEPPHYICANCYHHAQKSILQPFKSQYSHSLSCPRCKTELTIG